MKILCLDIPNYHIDLPENYLTILKHRIFYQNQIISNRLNQNIIRSDIHYSRGLLSIATSLKKANFDVEYIVYNDSKDLERFPEITRQSNVLLLSLMTPTVKIGLDIAEKAKKINPKIKVIVGGPHAQVESESLVENQYIDIVSYGEGITNTKRIIDNLDDLTKTFIPSIIYKNNGKKINNKTEDLLRTKLLGESVDYSLLYRPINFYAHNVRTQNGCPFGCKYCFESQSYFTNKCNMEMEKLIEELKILSDNLETGTLVHFSDPVFTFDKERTLKLCKLIKSSNFKLFFSIDTRIDRIDEEIIKACNDANIIYFRFGIEDADNFVSETTNKKINFDNFCEISNMIRKYIPNAIIHGYWITGVPIINKETVENNAKMITKLVSNNIVDIIRNKVLVPYPGTDYYKNPDKYNMVIKTYNWEKYDRLSFPVFEYKDFSQEQIYNSFIFLEKTLIKAYKERLKNEKESSRRNVQNSIKINDYVLKNYVEKR